MGWFRNEDVGKDKYIEELREHYEELREHNTALSGRLTKQRREFDEIIDNKNKGCSIVLDFYNVDVFSIERNEGRTIVGHWITTNEPQKRQIRQWYFDCNTEVHEKLVAEYRDHMKLEREYDDE